MAWETVIGLEVHVELAVKSKIFCGCSTAFGDAPNKNTCEGCLGLPGTLPVLNEEVCEKAIAAGIVLGCEIERHSVFDRKHYFYPDLTKGYQLSQYYHHLCRNGKIAIEVDDQTRDIRINRIHIEEDAGKLVHDAGYSLVDGNRGGMALIEIVSEPDLRSADEAEAYIESLRENLVYAGVSDCKMQEGSMRADVNISVREKGSEKFGVRAEIKNMNSIKAIKRAIEYETGRHIEALETGTPLVQETRRWDDDLGKSFSMRNKETAQEYLYFPDPDLVPLYVSDEWISRVRESLPELPAEKRKRYKEELGLGEKTAGVLTAEKNIAELFEDVVAAIKSKDTKGKEKPLTGEEAAAEAANIITGEILRLIKDSGAEADSVKVEAEKLAAVILLVNDRKINRAAGREIVEAIFRSNVDPESYINEKGLSLIDDEAGIWAAAEKAIAENPKSVSDYLAGKEKAYGFLVGQTMRAFGGKADPELVNRALKELLGVSTQKIDSGPGDGSLENAADPCHCEERSDKAIQKKTDCANDAQFAPRPETPGLDCAMRSAPQTSSSSDFAGACPAASQCKSSDDYVCTPRPENETFGSDASDCVLDCADAKPGHCEQSEAIQKKAESVVDRSEQVEKQTRSTTPLKTSLRYRDMTCGDLRTEHIGQTVRLAGWVMAIRDHGGIVFFDLRDQYGITQVSCTEEKVEKIGKEFSVTVKGETIKRDPETFNPNIATGEVEIRADEIEVLGSCRNILPFEINQSHETREDLRLKYRYLDLRNPRIRDNIIMRGKVIHHLRHEMEGLGFTEIQTPILGNSSPEGARDYLVPSRKHKGKFYALPQAPQQFKQLLMVAGFDRYFQIAPCFRDEDSRLDRSPSEFYQLDFEMAYATQEDVFAVAERVLTSTFEKFSDKEVTQPPYPRFTYAETMLKYGTDKPDLRNPLEITDISPFFENVDFAPFKGKPVRAIRVPGASGQSKSWFKDMEKFALSIGMKGLGYITVQDDGSYKGPIDKFLADPQKKELGELTKLSAGDILYFISDEPEKVNSLAGQIRDELGRRLDLIDKGSFKLCFITDYPMYEYNEETGKIDFTHNPFSMPQGEMEALMTKDPLDILAWQYDIVCNGVELSSGAVRNHRPDIMIKAFEIAGYSEKDVEQKFGALYYAFSYGAPPHAGMAPGVSRIVMLITGAECIREVIAFPMNSNAQNTMLDAPSEVTEQQLRDVHIKIRD